MMMMTMTMMTGICISNRAGFGSQRIQSDDVRSDVMSSYRMDVWTFGRMDIWFEIDFNEGLVTVSEIDLRSAFHPSAVLFVMARGCISLRTRGVIENRATRRPAHTKRLRSRCLHHILTHGTGKGKFILLAHSV